MQRCLACTSRNFPEKIAHRILKRIGKKEGLEVEHFYQNSTEDKAGKDLAVIKGKKILFIQIKGRSRRKRTGRKSKNKEIKGLENRFKKDAPTLRDLKRYIFTAVNRYKRLKLLKNDKEIRAHFKQYVQKTDFFQRLRKEKDYRKTLELFSEVRYYINLFSAAIVHAKRYPNVKLFFIIDTSKGIDRRKRAIDLERDWTELIRQALKS